MKKALFLCAALVFVAGAAHAVTYTWINSATSGAGRDWQTGANWDLGKAPTTGDVAYVGNGGRFTSTADIVVGSLRVMSPSFFDIGTYNITTTTDNGGTGDLILRVNTYNVNMGTANVYGNYMFDCGTAINYDGPGTVNMYGNNTAYRNQSDRSPGNVNVYGTGVWDNGYYSIYNSRTITVKSGGSLGANASIWVAARYIFEDGQSNLPAWGSPVDFQYNCGAGDNGTMKLVVTGGVSYPEDVRMYTAAGASKTPFTYRVKGGDFKVKRDFTMGPGSGVAADLVFSSVENGTNAPVSFEVGQDLNVGYHSSTGIYILKLSTGISTVKVGRDIDIGERSDQYYTSGGSADLGNATIYVGRDFIIRNPHPSANPSFQKTLDAWNAGTSQIICTGNSLTNVNQTITTYCDKGFNLHTFIVRNPGGGTVSLAASDGSGVNLDTRAGELTLTGDLRLERGKFNDNDKSITFNGPGHTLFWDNNLCKVTGNSLDNIILLPNAVLYLDAGTHTTIQMDNIEMQSGSKLYLNGFTLLVEGSTFISDQVTELGVPYTAYGSDGTIYGTLPIPEPATLLLLGTGALGLIGWVRRRRIA